MATGTSIILYKNCKILKDENFILPAYNPTLVNSMYSYLLTLNSLGFTNIKFIKNKLDIEVIVQEDKTAGYIANAYTGAYNYALITQTNNNVSQYYLYFITKKEIISQHSLKLYLHLDVLNTFREDVHYKFSPLTHILRQHKSRFKQAYIYGQGYFYYPHIDEYSEGINPVMYKKEEEIIKFSTASYEYYYKWYMVYHSAVASGGAVGCFFVPDTPIEVKIGSNRMTLGTIKDVNLSSETLIKIIQIPYLPLEVQDDGSSLEIITQGIGLTLPSEMASNKYALGVTANPEFLNTDNIKDNIIILNHA